MRRLLITLFAFLLSFTLVNAQQEVQVMNFDTAAADTLYMANHEGEPPQGGPASYMTFEDDNTDFVEGTGALKIKYVIGAYHPWGSYGNAIHPDGGAEEPVYNFSGREFISIWMKIHNAPVYPEYMVFRMHLKDRPYPEADFEEYIYQNNTVIDAQADWFELKIPLVDLETGGNSDPNDQGFSLFPSGWTRSHENNLMLDLDKIVGWNISAVTAGWTDPALIPADSVVVSYDNMMLKGFRAVPHVFFNGKTMNTTFSQFTWGQSQLILEEGAGSETGKNAMKWTMGDEWANGWTGIGWNVDPAMNMLGSWPVDSVKIRVKAGTSTGALRVQFESSGGKVGKVFTPVADEQWHLYSLALKDFVVQDNLPDFDTSNVTVVGLMAEASAVAGNVVYFEDFWTGNPTIDVVPPAAPQSFLPFGSGDYVNLITWIDVTGESGELYNIYYSENPITSLEDEGIEILKKNIEENQQEFTHTLKAPLDDADVTYYYAIECMDYAGNFSNIVVSDAVTNKAKGSPVIHGEAPVNFAADGDLSDWAGIRPFVLNPATGDGVVVTNQSWDDANDLSANFYIATDGNYLYVAYDIEDDLYVWSDAQASYYNDSPDIFIGLYDTKGKLHTAYKRDDEPDYHFRFTPTALILDNLASAAVIDTSSSDFYHDVKFPTGYVYEAKVSLDSIAAVDGDALFVPEKGMRIPFDLAINDADATETREGIITLSPINQDKGYQDVSVWTHTWIGDMPTDVNDDAVVPYTFTLDQNYPNPFNPATQIKYSIGETGLVTLKVFNILGQEVVTLVNKIQSPGSYLINFDASSLTSGVYVYQIQSGSMISSKKMMLIK
ncbi:MAG: T9SS type A sorting domain-containing protein [Melioribacteraceae bacterium]|nr:T9SS type A sorting domain-containing protein [Melioribacteraceae bacterium]